MKPFNQLGCQQHGVPGTASDVEAARFGVGGEVSPRFLDRLTATPVTHTETNLDTIGDHV